MIKNTLFAIIASIFLSSCKHKTTEPSFYFWKTTFLFSPSEKDALKNSAVKNLYVRFFDVDLSTLTKKPQPLGVIDSLQLIPENISIIPVIFITNRTFLNSSEFEIDSLVKNVLIKTNNLYSKYNELQIDCDWSIKSQMKYFTFLKLIKKQLPNKIKLTTTIRLHQIKYSEKTGIPPVDGGMLMFYNIGNIHNEKEKNSIYDENTAKKYTSFIENYPLHLDVALPIFRWYIHFRNEKVIGLITKEQMPNTKDSTLFKNDNLKFTLKQSTLIKGIYYKKNDYLKFESLNDAQLLNAAKLLNESLPANDRRIVLYDLDEINIKYYEKETIKNVFATFN